MKTVYPWTDAAGNLLNDEELKTVSKKWSPEIWEAYLQTQEHIESDFVSHLEDEPAIRESATEDFRYLLSDPSPLKPALAKEIRTAVAKLSPRKMGIILDSYWDGVSEREQAKKSGIERGSIFRQKKVAKKQLKKRLLTESKHLASWKGEK